MNHTSETTDIESILNTQIWRNKRLPSISQSQKTFKIRSKTDIEKKRKPQRLTTDPYQIPGHQFDESLEDSQEIIKPKIGPKKSLFILATPLSVISEAVSDITSKSNTSQLLVPSFPKRQFGDKAKKLQKQEKFFCIEKIHEDQVIRLKLDYGRIGKNSHSKIKGKFEFTRQFLKSSEEFSEKLKVKC
jgi:hypothetical protein